MPAPIHLDQCRGGRRLVRHHRTVTVVELPSDSPRYRRCSTRTYAATRTVSTSEP